MKAENINIKQSKINLKKREEKAKTENKEIIINKQIEEFQLSKRRKNPDHCILNILL